ncbi:MAG TPA: TetR family transcriptional regulator [Micromonosporaceae bacterium]
MHARTVDWGGGARRRADGAVEGLRERRKRLLRQQLSDTATEMFMERGFDAVRIIDVADACGVSEKTVYNYFPTKESLVLDRWDTTSASIRTGFASVDLTPVEAAVRILDDELDGLTSWLDRQDDPARATAAIRRFGDLIAATPALRAHQRDVTDRLVVEASAALAARTGLGADDPRPRIAAIALLGLWEIQFRALHRYVDGGRTPAELRTAVAEDVRRAADLIADGLDSLATAPAADRVSRGRAEARHGTDAVHR